MVSGVKSVLYLSKVSEIGGAEISLQTLVGNLRGTDFWPVVVLGQGGPLRQRLEEMDIKVYVYPLDWCHLNNPLPFMRTIAFLRRIIKREDIKLIHANTLWDNQYGVISAKLARIPHILHVRGFSKDQYSWKSLYHLGSMIICNSEYTCSQFINSSRFRKRVEVIYNGIDTNIFKPDSKKRSDMREHYRFSINDFVMGMAGRFVEDKGFLQILKSILHVINKNRNYKIIICGDDKCYYSESDYHERLRAFIRTNKLEDQILLAGFVEDMPAFYNAIDLFLLPSKREPFGRVLVEAMATHIPTVASRVDGVPEVVDHEKTGYLVDPRDAVGWCRYIDKLVSNEFLRKAFGEAGRRKVLEKFTRDHVTSKVVSIYRELIDDS